ncbi:MAG: metallophosphoesterase [Gemmatimonadota bacterium]
MAIGVRVAAYLLLAWGTVAALASGLFAGALGVVLAVAVYTLIPLAAFLVWRGWPFYPGAGFRLVVVRPFWYVQLVLPLVAGAGLIGLGLGAPFGAAVLAGRVLAGSVLLAAVGLLGLGYWGSAHLVVRQVDAGVPGLPAEFEGLRIVQLSDLHVGPHTSRRFLRRIADTIPRLRPDLIAVTGDMVDDRAEDVAVYAEALGSLDAPLGVYLIPGNHDVYAGWEAVERALGEANAGTVLVNEARLIRRGPATIALVGTGDPAGGQPGSSRVAPDLAKALALVPKGATVIALAHNPALWPALAERGVALTLSGHTHWGQLAIPARGWSLASRFLERSMGAHTRNESILYISPGTGYWGLPFRLGASPEVTLVTVRRADRAAAQVHAAKAA